MFSTRAGRIPVLLLILSGCSRAPRVDTVAEANAIRELDLRWQAAVDAKDIEACLSLYVPDAMQMPANSLAFVGTEAIGKWYESWLMEPGVSNTFAPEIIEVAASGDLAYDRGTYRFAVDTPEGRAEDAGKYIVIWKKINGDWKVLADISNSDTPLPVQ
jgi:uncharacterized protein (TIGR02246 family)